MASGLFAGYQPGTNWSGYRAGAALAAQPGVKEQLSSRSGFGRGGGYQRGKFSAADGNRHAAASVFASRCSMIFCMVVLAPAARFRADAREADEAIFGGGVDLGVGEGDPAGHRGDVHDVAPAPAQHPIQGGMKKRHRRDQVELEGAQVLLDGHGMELAQRVAARRC